MNIEISPAIQDDSVVLSQIAFAAKKHWGYPNEYMEIWKQELTITKEYLTKNIVYKLVNNEEIIGFYALVLIEQDYQLREIEIKKGWWLDHLFILPQFHHQGFGKQLIKHSKSVLIEYGEHSYFIFVDPFATGFYEKMGAQFLYESASSIPERTIPVFKLSFP